MEPSHIVAMKIKYIHVKGIYGALNKCQLLLSRISRTSLVVQWLRIHLPMQGTRGRSLVWEDPHAEEQLSPCTTTPEHAL